MILSAFGFIFLHAPKTGGNSMQLLLQPFSDDRIVPIAGADPSQRFAVKGPITRDKHARLQAYADVLGPDLGGCKVALTARDPFARAVSHYFSPHRWSKRRADGEPVAIEPVWEIGRFRKMLEEMDRLVDLVTVDGALRRPDMLIRQERLASDFEAFVQAAGLPIRASDLPRANASAGPEPLYRAALEDARAQDAVRARFAADYELLAAFEHASA